MDDTIVYNEEIKQVMRLFEDRDLTYIKQTQNIVNTIGPTVLTAMLELFALPVEQVQWLDFQASTNLLIVVTCISFTPSKHIPAFILNTSANIPDETSTNKFSQVIRIGIPFEMVLASSEIILDFLKIVVESHKKNGPTLIHYADLTIVEEEVVPVAPPAQPTVEPFDTAVLTDHQRWQLLMYDNHPVERIH